MNKHFNFQPEHQGIPDKEKGPQDAYAGGWERIWGDKKTDGVGPEVAPVLEEEVNEKLRFSAETKLNLNPEQLELFEKIEKNIPKAENAVIERAKGVGMNIETLNKVGTTWKNVPTRYKLLISAGMIVSGATLGAAAVTPLMVIGTGLRALGGASMFVGLEEALKKQDEKGGIERSKSRELTHKVMAGTLSLLIAGVLPGIIRDSAIGHGLMEKMHEVLGGGTTHVSGHAEAQPPLPDDDVQSSRDALNRRLDDLSNSIKAGDTKSVMLAEETLGISHEEALKLIEQRASTLSTESLATSITPPTEEEFNAALSHAGNVTPETATEFIVTVEQGDSVWKLVHAQLENVYGEKFTDLSETQQAHLIDAIKDKIVADPEHFGIVSGDANVLSIGDEVNFKEIFEDKQFMGTQLAVAEHVSTIENVTPAEGTHAVAEPVPLAEEAVVETPPRTLSAEEFLSQPTHADLAPQDAHISEQTTDAMTPEIVPTAPQIIEYADQHGALDQPEIPPEILAAHPEILTNAKIQVASDIKDFFGSTGWFLGFGSSDGMEVFNGFAGRTVDDVMHTSATEILTKDTEKMQKLLEYTRAQTHIKAAHGEKVVDYLTRASAHGIAMFYQK